MAIRVPLEWSVLSQRRLEDHGRSSRRHIDAVLRINTGSSFLDLVRVLANDL